MATSKNKGSNATLKPVGSVGLQGVLKRVKASGLSSDDKAALADILSQSIKLRKLIEKSTVTLGDKKVIARLPNGFDIVK